MKKKEQKRKEKKNEKEMQKGKKEKLKLKNGGVCSLLENILNHLGPCGKNLELSGPCWSRLEPCGKAMRRQEFRFEPKSLVLSFGESSKSKTGFIELTVSSKTFFHPDPLRAPGYEKMLMSVLCRAQDCLKGPRGVPTDNDSLQIEQ